MSSLRSSARYAAIRCLISTFRGSCGPKQCARTTSTLTSHLYARQHNRSARGSEKHRSLEKQSTTLNQGATADASTRPVENVAILGGGITGLTAAWYISHAFPNAKVTVYEAKDVYGGWFQTVRERQIDGSPIVFEVGPRSLRPTGIPGFAMLNLVDEIGLHDEILRPNANSRERYVYYPDHLARMPGPGQGLLDNYRNIQSEPIFEGFLSGLFQEFVQPTRSPELSDESIGSFVSRRLGTKVANNIVSAVFHAWRMEQDYGSLTRGTISSMWKKQRPVAAVDWAAYTAMMGRMFERPDSSASDIVMTNRYIPTISFREGLQMLPNRLVTKLKDRPNVTLRDKTKVTGLATDSQMSQIQIREESQSASFDHVISTLQPQILLGLLQDGGPEHKKSFTKALNPLLEHERPVDVAVVNVFYRHPTGSRPPGFGYLIPQSVPFEQNPECALGVVFDSDVFNYDAKNPEPQGEVLSVMFGGHWWDGRPLPSDEDLQEYAQAVLSRHLGITQKPTQTLVNMNRSCIPQYTVGHEDRLATVHDMLSERFGGRLRVAGSAFTGVSVNDCILAGWRSAEDLRGEIGGILKPSQRTGLERFKYGNPRLLIHTSGLLQRIVGLKDHSPHFYDGSLGLAETLLGERSDE